jgi:nucleotide-binding universal stress UspA family protein
MPNVVGDEIRAKARISPAVSCTQCANCAVFASQSAPNILFWGCRGGAALAIVELAMTRAFGFKRILAPVDFSPCSERALEHAFAFAEKSGASVHVLHVWEPSPYVSATDVVYLSGEQQVFWDHMRRELGEKLDALVERCRGDASDVQVEVSIEAGYTSKNILATLEKEPYDLVVMGTHGRKWLSHLLLGSVAAKVVRLAPCPVLTVRAPEPDEDEPREDKPPGRGFETPTHI